MKYVRPILLFLVTIPVTAVGAGFDHEIWDSLLEKHVVAIDGGRSTAVDYAGMASDREALDGYVASTAAVEAEQFDRWTESEQLAFLINVYNARTVELILTAWPELDSIRELGSPFRSPWEKRFFELLGERRSLDALEHGLIRGNYDEPRIHFAVNCASVGCPALRRETYVGGELDSQLESATRTFLGDRSRNRLEQDTLYVSPIFDWYRTDFREGFRGADSLNEFLALYAGALGLGNAERQRLQEGGIEIAFLDYDWALNESRNRISETVR